MWFLHGFNLKQVKWVDLPFSEKIFHTFRHIKKSCFIPKVRFCKAAYSKPHDKTRFIQEEKSALWKILQYKPSIDAKILYIFREASTQLSNGSHIEMASRSQICEFLHQDLNFGAFFILLDIWFIFFIALACKSGWCIGKHSCLWTRRPGFKLPYCQNSFFSFKSWWRNSKICDQDAISIWPPLDSWVNAILVWSIHV